MPGRMRGDRSSPTGRGREPKKPVARALVFGDLSEGGTVSVTVLDGKIALAYTLAS